MAELSGRDKAAAILLSIDSEAAAAVLKNLSEPELASVTKAMYSLGRVEPQDAAAVFHEFAVGAATDTSAISASPAVLRERLSLAVGDEGARQLLQEIGADDGADKLFESLEELSPEELYKIIVDEHPQTIAVVLSHLQSKLTASALSLFPADVQSDVIRRMASTHQTDRTVLRHVGEIIRNKTGSLGEFRKTPDDPRYKKVAEVIHLLGQEAEERILKDLSEQSPDVAGKVRDMMLVFEDLGGLSDADMRKVLMAVDTQVLAMALKTASEVLKDKIFSNLSRRATETVREELELLGLKPLSEVKAAQQQIVETVRNLESSGEITIRGVGAEEDPLV